MHILGFCLCDYGLMSGTVCILFVLFAVAMMYMSSWYSIFSTFAVLVCNSSLFIGSGDGLLLSGLARMAISTQLACCWANSTLISIF